MEEGLLIFRTEKILGFGVAEDPFVTGGMTGSFLGTADGHLNHQRIDAGLRPKGRIAMKELVTLNINASSQGNEKLIQMARHVSFLSDCSPNAPSCADGNPMRTRRAEISCLNARAKQI